MINPVLIKDKIPFNVEKDFTYLYGMAALANIWIVHAVRARQQL